MQVGPTNAAAHHTNCRHRKDVCGPVLGPNLEQWIQEAAYIGSQEHELLVTSLLLLCAIGGILNELVVIRLQ